MNSKALPELIQQFAERNCPQDFSSIKAVYIEQQGEMRLAPDKPWGAFKATQDISAQQIEFEWRARIKLAHLLWAKVIDAYTAKHGKLKASLWGIIPMANATGPSIDRGEIQRYLAELPWCPAALLNNPMLNFKNLSDDVVRVWYGDEQTYVDLHFDADGDIVSTRSETREREGFGRQPWIGQFDAYQDIGGLRIPQKGTVKWETPDGPFEYWKGKIVSLKIIS